MRKIAFVFFIFSFVLTKAQDKINFEDDKYLEDQFYASISYLRILNEPNQISQTGFSYGLGFGFIKDLPVNKRRNIAFGIGLGYGFNNNYFNVKVLSIPENDPNNELKSNKITTHSIELPVEFRFRTSTSKKYNFWRVYPGVKFSYVFAQNAKLKQREDFDVSDVIQVSKFLYGTTISAGYNKWNFYFYYGLNNLFTNTEQNPYEIGISDMRLGLIFYIL